MRTQLCLVLALATLLGALATGNPFLDRGRTADDGAPAAAANAEPSPPFALHVPASEVHLASHAGPAAEPATAQRSGRVAPAFALSAGGATRPVSAGEACPDATLREHVVDVGRDRDGRTVWFLRDGRAMAKNPKAGASEPLLVEVAQDAAGRDDG